jgi:hypothetical protein
VARIFRRGHGVGNTRGEYGQTSEVPGIRSAKVVIREAKRDRRAVSPWVPAGFPPRGGVDFA